MNDTDFLHLLMRHQDGVLSRDELAALETAMRDDTAKRRLFAEAQLRSTALHDHFRQEAFRLAPVPKKRITWITRPIAAMAAGLMLGLFGASLVWAISSPRVTAERLFSLINGNFEADRIANGFPRQTGGWSGDAATIDDGRLRFLAPGSDSADPSARAISCDVFQLLDLRPLLNPEGDSVLELSADFLDARPPHSKPSVTFFCQLYLFSGDWAMLHETWPQNNTEALATGSAQVTTLGSDTKGARTLTAKCLVPAEADFAVIQIAARPNLRPAKLDNLFADNVKLTLKTRPILPLRTVVR